MNLSLITAISSHELEDRVIATLAENGFTLTFRVISLGQSEDFIPLLKDEERTLLVIDEHFNNLYDKLKLQNFVNLAILELKESEKLQALEILNLAHTALRESASRDNAPRALTLNPRKRNPRWIGVTGGSGSPGISTCALNIASEISHISEVTLLDLDIVHQDLHVMAGVRREGPSALTSSLTLLSTQNWDDNVFVESHVSSTCILDLGEMPYPSQDLLKDRRAEVRKFLDYLSRCHQLVYVVQLESRALTELDAFLEFAIQELSDHKITFVVNKSGNSSRQKSLLRSVLNRISNRPYFVLPQDPVLFDRSKGRFATLEETAPRSPARRALEEASIYLIKSL